MTTITINQNNPYIKAAKRIKTLCAGGKWDVQTATSMWEHEAGFKHDHDLYFEFSDTINAVGSLDNLIEQL